MPLFSIRLKTSLTSPNFSNKLRISLSVMPYYSTINNNRPHTVGRINMSILPEHFLQTVFYMVSHGQLLTQYEEVNETYHHHSLNQFNYNKRESSVITPFLFLTHTHAHTQKSAHSVMHIDTL